MYKILHALLLLQLHGVVCQGLESLCSGRPTHTSMCKLLKAVSRLTLALTGHLVHAKPAVVLLQHQCVLVGANDFYNDLRAQCPNACGASMPDSSIHCSYHAHLACQCRWIHGFSRNDHTGGAICADWLPRLTVVVLGAACNKHLSHSDLVTCFLCRKHRARALLHQRGF